MTTALEQALLDLDQAGRLGSGDPDCDCDTCTQDREVRAVLDAYYAESE